MVVFAIHLNQLGLEIVADVGEDGTKSVNGISVEYAISVLRDEDQVDVKMRNAVSAVSDVT